MNKTIGILHLTFPYGGAETATIRLAKGLSGHGFKIYVFCTEYRENRAENANGDYEIVRLPNAKKPASPRNIRFLKDAIQTRGITCLCVACDCFLPIMSALKDKKCVPLVYIQHNQPFWEKRSQLDLDAKKGFMKARVACIDLPKEKLFGYYTRRWKRIYTDLYDNCDAYVTLHPQYSREIAEAIGRDGKKFTAIPNMVSPVNTIPAEKKKEILYSGRMSHRDKRIDRLIKIWGIICDKAPDWELVLVGDGKERKRLQALAARLALPRIRFEGWQKDVSQYYREASIVCLTSSFESFGLCLTEGMSHGCVPVAFNCSAGVADIVQAGGCLIPPFRLDEYAAALLRLVTDDKFREEQRRKSLASVKRFHPQEIIPLWTTLFERLQKA